MKLAFGRTFSSLRVRNFRLFVAGQFVSLTGTWMQTVAQALLVLELTGRGTDVGIAFALQYVPLFVLAPVGGVIADRFNKRKVMFCTQGVSGLLALTLAILVVTGTVELWMVYVLAAGLGIVNTIDSPVRLTIVPELVGRDQLTNAVSLNAVMVNLARIIGPALAGVLVATVGLAACFFYNAASFAAVMVSLVFLQTSKMQPAPRIVGSERRVREALVYVRSKPQLLVPLVVLAVVGTFAWEYPVSLPIMAEFAFHGDEGTLAAMTAVLGLGATLGGLGLASRLRPTGRSFVLGVIVFGVAILAVSVAPTFRTALVTLFFMGMGGVMVASQGNATLQLETTPEMRGRVMSLWNMAFNGSTVVGGPLIGWIGDHAGPRYALGIGGVASLLAGVCAYPALVGRAPGRRRDAAAAAPGGERVTESTAAT